MSGIFGNFGTTETVSINCLISLSSVKPVFSLQDSVEDVLRHGVVKLRGIFGNDSFDFNNWCFDADDRPGGNKYSLLIL